MIWTDLSLKARTALLSVAVGLGWPVAGVGQIYEAHDSAGVRIVTAGPTSAETGASWTVPPEPILQIGKMEGEEPYLFTRVWDALRAPDGRVVVVEGRSYAVRVFGPDGGHVTTFGRRGGGPKEFGGPPRIAMRSLDTLVTWDPGHYRFSKYSLSGALLDQRTVIEEIDGLSIPWFPNGRVWQIARDGTLLWIGPPPAALPQGEGLAEQTRRVVLVNNGGSSHHDFGSIPAGETFWLKKGSGQLYGVLNPYAPVAWAVLGPGPDRVSISDAEEWEVRSYNDSGGLRRILRSTIPRRKVTRALVQRARQELPRLSGGIPEKDALRAFEQIPVPDRLPAIQGLFWDLTGDLWVGRASGSPFEQPRDYDVFDPDGHWLGLVEMPERVDQVFEVGSDYILVSWRDENDVQYVRIYRLNRRGSL